MESALKAWVPVAGAVGLGIGALVLGVRWWHRRTERLMQASTGGIPFEWSNVPFLGHAAGFADQESFLDRLYAQPEFRDAGLVGVSVLGDLYVIVFDPFVLDQIHTGKKREELDVRWPPAFVALAKCSLTKEFHEPGAPTGLKRIRNSIIRFAGVKSSAAQFPNMVRVLSRHVDAWKAETQGQRQGQRQGQGQGQGEGQAPDGFVDATARIPVAIMDFVLVVLAGTDFVDGPHGARFRELWEPYFAGFTSVPIAALRGDYAKALGFKDELVALLRDFLQLRLAEAEAASESESVPGAGAAAAAATPVRIDFVQKRLDDAAKSGVDPLSDDFVIDILVTLSAAVDTTVWSSSRIVQCMAEQPHVLAKVRQEVRQALGPAGLHEGVVYEDAVAAMPYAKAVCSEIMRFFPVSTASFRNVYEPFDVTTRAGRTFHLPKDARVWSPHHIVHRTSPDWTDPGAFEPERFLAPRDELGNAKFKSSYMPFGIGGRQCPGQELAKTELFVLVTLLADFEQITLKDDVASLDWRSNPIVKPHKPMWFTGKLAAK